LAFPILTALGLVGLAPSAVLIAVASTAAFLAHEPLLVLMGRRGPRARREDGLIATRWLVACSGVALLAGLWSILLTPPSAQWAFLVPAVPLAALVWALFAHREKTAMGESSVALTFASLACPMCLSAGAPVAIGFAVALAFGGLFLASTLAVRVVILSVRGGGDPVAVGTARRLCFTAIAAWCVVLVAAGGRLLPWATLVAIVPGVVVATVVAAYPPSASHLRKLGWTIVATSATAAAILTTALRAS
jgi:hypothetical protein